MKEELLIKLLDTFGPSGSEYSVRAIIEKEMKDLVDEMYTDKLGNLICHKSGKGGKVMLTAHMDEIGLIIRDIKEDGKIKFSVVGGVDRATLLGQYVAILNRENEIVATGVITYQELQDDLIIEEMPEVEDLHIDTGLKKQGLIKKRIGVGAFAVPFQEARFLGNKDVIAGKALDDRIGCFILIELAKRLKDTDNDIYYVFTVQEEVGLYGAQIAVYKIDPDWGIAVDVTNAEDYEKECVLECGKGPVISVMDAEMISNRCINDWLLEIARKKRIPVQFKVDDTGTTDATKIMLSRGGVPSTVVGVAVRNLHSTISTANLNDIKDAIELLHELMKNPPKVCFA
ncbi:M28 family peptidase [Candidatus Woesearchaeota archaeon]|nr:M28 family peptidase [Candidatus Woesearchaeota archaeon]MBW3021655.1 M28 family peptidase [Candidatus Woesearchaeota archaeon]